MKKAQEAENGARTAVETFPGGSVVETLCFQCRGHGFNHLLGQSSHARWYSQKKKKREEEAIEVKTPSQMLPPDTLWEPGVGERSLAGHQQV